jgi:hypothetical protein
MMYRRRRIPVSRRALAVLGFHVSLPEWRDSLCALHRAFYDTFIPRCAENQRKWMREEEKETETKR